ncbi:winged helix-turn-helix domain-containing protein [Haladaptatus litoreus]|uniref:winged helix-turn-helix domain-containing protein n=1 Tax=Haladaptatus litoreus TaxID=553468 RepID=UPI00097072E6|nr:winged helix-turn-helix domain-containing protein [Haladaptatus litoreus]
MDGTLWYVLSGSRGDASRARLLREVGNRPQNANQLSTTLDLDYSTIRHHLDVLAEHEIVEQHGDGEYGSIYTPTSAVKREWQRVTEIIEKVSE